MCMLKLNNVCETIYLSFVTCVWYRPILVLVIIVAHILSRNTDAQTLSTHTSGNSLCIEEIFLKSLTEKKPDIN